MLATDGNEILSSDCIGLKNATNRDVWIAYF